MALLIFSDQFRTILRTGIDLFLHGLEFLHDRCIYHIFRNILAASGIDCILLYCRNERRDCVFALFVMCLHCCDHVFL